MIETILGVGFVGVVRGGLCKEVVFKLRPETERRLGWALALAENNLIGVSGTS